MAKRPKRPAKIWVYSPKKPPKSKIPPALKAEAEARANALVETVFKPEALKPPLENPQFNYITDIHTTWFRSYLYFCAIYTSPFPDAISPTFEVRFTRLEYAGGDRFHLAYMRHTGQWWQVFSDLTLDEAMETIEKTPHFHIM